MDEQILPYGWMIVLANGPGRWLLRHSSANAASFAQGFRTEALPSFPVAIYSYRRAFLNITLRLGEKKGA
jgi:hypothetical protein